MFITNLHRKKLFFIVMLAILTTPSCFYLNSKHNTFAFSEVLFKNEQPSQTLISLLQLTGLGNTPKNLDRVVAATQQEWLRKPGQERWDVQEQYEEKRNDFIPLFDALKITDEIYPTKKHYKYAVLFGAALFRTRTRLAYLTHLYNNGITFDHIVVLGGARPLDPKIESEHDLLNSNVQNLPLNKEWQKPDTLPTTEMEMMRFVFDQTALPFDKNLVNFVDTPMQTKPDGTQRRPITPDTIHSWMQEKPEPGDALFISSQPYVGYQDTVARTYMPKEFAIETVGEGISADEKDTIKVSVTLDNIARWLYQIKKLQETQS